MDIQKLWEENNATHQWEPYVEELKKIWAQQGTENTTIFVGDSYFDASAFWTDFYTVYAGKDALCLGIGATHSYSWEVLADKLLSGMSPRNLVMHLGTNNIYDMGDNAAEATEGLQRMLNLLHRRMPATKMYYFTITQRSYDEEKQREVTKVNKNMTEWCSRLDWITCLNTSPLFTYDMLKDTVHPTLPSYSIFVEALEKVGVEIADKSEKDMTIKEKMHSGALYLPLDEELFREQLGCLDKLYDFNATRPTELEKRTAMLKEMFAEIGEGCYIEPPLHANWAGRNVHFGKNVYANFNLTLVDDTHIYVGDCTMIGPNVVIATGGHPVLPELREQGYQFNAPVTIGRNCWLGAGVVIVPGVTIGDNTVIGAGSVVTKDIPANVVAVGNPCRILREINDRDREYYFKNRKIDESLLK